MGGAGYGAMDLVLRPQPVNHLAAPDQNAGMITQKQEPVKCENSTPLGAIRLFAVKQLCGYNVEKMGGEEDQ